MHCPPWVVKQVDTRPYNAVVSSLLYAELYAGEWWRGAQGTAKSPTHPRQAGSRGRPCPPPRGAAQARGYHPIK